MVVEEGGTGWWLDSGKRELVEQQAWMPLSKSVSYVFKEARCMVASTGC